MHSEMTPPFGTPVGPPLRGLAGSEAPPGWLEDHVVAELATRGHLRTGGRRRRYVRTLVAAAAAIAIFAAGALAGARRDAPADGPRYALLLLDGPGYTEPTPADVPAVVERYRDWAIGLRRERVLVLAEKLDETVAVLPDGGGGNVAGAEHGLLGMFVVVAANDDAAAAIAAASPHVQQGGRVIVVRIGPT